ncbi:MAG: hypothetical protein EXX96DRAFT_652122 [Benjaminiella poitrasii]|nr:MAG: hypothetical protein EXX96DRAFT_652122 [Benjaminiella poitrasii]
MTESPLEVVSNNNAEQQQQQQQENHIDEDQLNLRSLVSTKEAGVIIGKGGKNVAELRESTGVRAGVSKVVQGIHDRVLTVSGSLEGVAKAYSLIARTILDNPVSTSPSTNINNNNNNNNNSQATIRLLISHNLMGTVIGRQGTKIKHIQDITGVRMIASKTLLPQSTERVVEIRGTTEAIEKSILEIGSCLIEDKERSYGTILYNPIKATNEQPPWMMNSNNSTKRNSNRPYNHNGTSGPGIFIRTGNGADFNNSNKRHSSYHPMSNNNMHHPPIAPLSRRSSLTTTVPPSNIRVQHISIPSDMVGCIIGKGGSKISEIRQLSGSRISIAKVPHDNSGERMFTIQGTLESNEKALYLLYGQLENEKERRLRTVMLHDDDDEEEEQDQQQQNAITNQ